MPLTDAQLAELQADILADPTLNAQPNTVEGNTVIATAYNTQAAPDFWVRRSSITKAEITGETSQDGTNFTWVGNGFITRAAGEQATWNQLFDAFGTVNPSLPNNQQAFADIFSGTGNAAANRTHLLSITRRRATRIEALLATGTGSTASPARMGYEGRIEYWDVEQARIYVA